MSPQTLPKNLIRSIYKFLMMGFIGSTLGTLSKAKASDDQLTQICGKFYLIKDNDQWFTRLRFDENEKIMICGAETPGWTKIPEDQSRRNLEVILRSYGYYNISIQEKDDMIIVDKGERTKVGEINFTHPPLGFKDRVFLGVGDDSLNSKTLDKIESWSAARLRSLGHPCPEVKLLANPNSGDVEVNLKPGEKINISKVDRSGLGDIRPQAITRFDAFKIGDTYNADLFELTSRRLTISGLADYSDFHNYCRQKNLKKGEFKQEVMLSQPRSLVVAFGASTEQFPIAKAQVRHNRLDANASRALLQLHLSSVEQSIDGNVQWHLFNNYPRLYLQPQFEISRNSENFYEVLKQTLSTGVGLTHDDSSNHYFAIARPTYNVEDTVTGSGPAHTSFFSLESELGLISHYYEFFQTTPREGYELRGDWSTRREGLGSAISGDRFLLEGTWLHNWSGFDPPQTVFGVRFRLASLRSPTLQDAPTSLRLFLGGDNDIRGFSRKSINNGGLGFSDIAYVGTEARFTHLLPFNLQPFVLMDFAKTAVEEFSFSQTLYWSPGLGLRWQSPIGSLRGTAAYGMTVSDEPFEDIPDDQWTFFLSFGQEF